MEKEKLNGMEDKRAGYRKNHAERQLILKNLLKCHMEAYQFPKIYTYTYIYTHAHMTYTCIFGRVKIKLFNKKVGLCLSQLSQDTRYELHL